MHHFYVRLAEPGHLGVGITWPDPTDEFDLYVYRGRLGENDPAPPNDQRLGFDQAPASGGKKGLLFEDLDPGDYTVRVIYEVVIEGSYQGRVWSPPPAADIIPPASSGPGERREYPLDPGDPLFDDQWGLEKIGAPEAWQEDRSTGHGITIGIVDSGVDLQHPDFACPGKLLILPGATIGSGKAPSDSDGHGTHVAGIAGACAGNEEGGAGVAPDATIMPVNADDAIRARNVGPGSTDAAMAEGIRFATHNGAHVINLSIGPPPWEGSHFPEMHPETEAALQEAREAGVVVVAAAGNYSSPVCEFPSLSRSVICVGATDRNDRKTYYSDFPANVDRDMNPAPSVLAPGGEANIRCWEAAGEEVVRGIVSTWLTDGVEDTSCGHPRGYREITGTSMASPFVAGVAALVYDRLGGARSEENADDVIRAITTTAVDLYAPGWDPLSGWGRVDAHAAVASVKLPEVSFTPDSATSGQFTDDTHLEARLVDQNGEPLEGEELVFTLTGSGSERSFTGVTDADGRSSVTPKLTESPGAYQLTVRYGGSDEHAPSASTVVGYVVVKEDTATELVVTRDRGDKTLTARLSDLDSPADGIDARTMSFYSDGELLGSSDTAGGGVASFTLPPGHKGNNRTYEAVFSGDDHFLSSSDVEHGNRGGEQDQQSGTPQFLRSGRRAVSGAAA